MDFGCAIPARICADAGSGFGRDTLARWLAQVDQRQRAGNQANAHAFQRRRLLAEQHPGKAVPYDVDWDSLENDAADLNFLDNLSCHRLNMALRMICIDELGKAAVRYGLKRIRLKNVSDPGCRLVAFNEGVLEMHCAYAQDTSGMIGESEIHDALVAKP